MTGSGRVLAFSVPGKVVINGGYIVCLGEECVAVNVDAYARVLSTILADSPGLVLIDTKTGGPTTLRCKEGCVCVERAADAETAAFLSSITTAFLEVVGATLQAGVCIKVAFDKGFWTPGGTKTGIGSSSCLLVAVVRSLVFLCGLELDVPAACLEINRRIAPRASGVDVVVCAYGNAIYSKGGWRRTAALEGLNLVLGSLERSSNTREMLRLLDADPGCWAGLTATNAKIIVELHNGSASGALRTLYREYTEKLRMVSALIVPDAQYSVILQTLERDVVGCGASGSGGEDCVWCIVDDSGLDGVVRLWQRCFAYVGCHRIPGPGGVME